MTVEAMRTLDRYIGGFVCRVLATLLRIAPRSPQPRRRPRKALFLKLAEQGTTVLARPAMESMVRRVGRENVFFLVFEENRFIVDALGLVPARNVIVLSSGGAIPVLASAARALLRIRRARIDTTVDLEFLSNLTAVFALLTGATRRLGFHAHAHGLRRGRLLTHPVLLNPYLHVVQSYLALVEVLDADASVLPAYPLQPEPPEDSPPVFRPSEGDRRHVEALLGSLGGRHPLFLVNPNAGDLVPQRRWPPDRYPELIRRLLERYPEAAVLVTGSAREAEAGDRVAQQVADRRCLSVAGKTTLPQLLTLYCLADVLVTNDSGPAHFAALTPIRVVTLFGPETPLLFAAPTSRNRVLWAGLACSPCLSAFGGRFTSCRRNLCMEQISVDEVSAAISEHVGAGGERRLRGSAPGAKN